MTKLGELYTDFFRVDLDAPGGYARVADVIARQADGTFVHHAFKLLRHDLNGRQVALQRFENELKILVEITRDKNAPPAITQIYDSGFVEVELSKSLHKLRDKDEKLTPTPNLEVVSTGTDIQKFLDAKSALMEKEPDHWLPYLVVDLAHYDDSLLRQIRAQQAGNFVNLYGLPVSTIVEMALQLLDVMDYMHKTLRYAYMDWKPEHIYWSEASRKLKLIDWNVTTRLNGGNEEKQIIREDIRMFSGAALYCSLALTDPEDQIKSIGVPPTAPRNKAPVIIPRYWTDKPNFYHREEILDEEIKQLVQKALDPNQGFNSPQDLKHALFQYAGKNSKHIKMDSITGLPFNAVQYFRRARSYIAASDFSYAILWLELAVETAKKTGVSYSDAERLLENVRDLMVLNEVKQKVKPVLEKGQWKDALDLYAKAAEQHPENAMLKKEFEGLHELLGIEQKLHKKGVFKIFANLFRLQTILTSTKDVINPENPLYSFVKQQYGQIRLIQTVSVFILIFFALVASISTGAIKFSRLIPVAPTLTNTAIFIPSITPSETASLIINTLTFTNIPSSTPTNTPDPTPTPTLTILAYGKLMATYFRPYDEPNKTILESSIERGQFLVIIAQKEVNGALWYECIWDINGVPGKGWVLADKIKIVQPPTPTVIP